MDNVRLNIQVDFGVGDVMTPGPRVLEYPVFLDSDTIQLRAYPIESAIAEKLQAMVALGSANSRMKDFYDVWICSKHLDFDTDMLLDAIGATLENRETPVPAEDFDVLTADFADQHRGRTSFELLARDAGPLERLPRAEYANPVSAHVAEPRVESC